MSWTGIGAVAPDISSMRTSAQRSALTQTCRTVLASRKQSGALARNASRTRLMETATRCSWWWLSLGLDDGDRLRDHLAAVRGDGVHVLLQEPPGSAAGRDDHADVAAVHEPGDERAGDADDARGLGRAVAFQEFAPDADLHLTLAQPGVGDGGRNDGRRRVLALHAKALRARL